MPNCARVSVPRRQKSSASRISIRLPSLAARHQRHEKITEYAHRDRERIVMAKTVADQFAETLAAAGVKRIYGIVGDSLNGLPAKDDAGLIEELHAIVGRSHVLTDPESTRRFRTGFRFGSGSAVAV